jgi:hypothetical protein
MKASEIFHKTARGQSEVEARSNALSVKERRVLILVNGENNAATLKQLSLCENIVEILETLLEGGFIQHEDMTNSATYDRTQPRETKTADDVSARAFMNNTLLTYGNRFRVAKLIEDIGSVDSLEELKNLVKPWYQAISETPGGMYQADNLRNEVQKRIADEEALGLR